MTHLQDIPIVTDAVAGPGEAPNAHAVLVELETLLAQLLKSGKESSIDLRSLPMGPGDWEYLREVLGQGEVEVTVEALGPSTVFETAIKGIWWVTHYNSDNGVMAEFLEVTACPDIIRSHPADMQDSLEVLRSRIILQPDA